MLDAASKSEERCPACSWFVSDCNAAGVCSESAPPWWQELVDEDERIALAFDAAYAWRKETL